MPDPPTRHLVIGPAGLQKWANPEDLGNLPKGYSPASPEEQRAVLLDEKYSGAAGTAKKALAVADEAVLNLGSATAATVADAVGADQTAAGVRNVKRELSEAIGPEGQLLGAGIGLLASGGVRAGTGAAGMAARGLGGAERAVTVAGSAAERFAAKHGAGTVARGAVRAGTEGAMVGGAHALTEAALGNAELTGEAVAMGVFGGAAMGGALGAGVSKFGQTLAKGGGKLRGALRRPGSKALAAVAEGHLGTEVKPGVGSALASSLSSARADDIAAMAGSAERRAAAVYGQDAVEEAVRTIKRRGDDILDGQSLFYELQTKGKAANFEPMVAAAQRSGEIAPTKAVHATIGAVEDAKALATKLGSADDFGSAAGIDPFTRRINTIEKRVQKIVADGGDDMAAKLRTENERLKRHLDKFTKRWGRAGKGGGYENELLAARSAEAKLVADVQRRGLEDAGTWGRAAADAQKAFNGATGDSLSYRGKFDSSFVTKAGRDKFDPYETRRVIDDAKLRGQVDRLDDSGTNEAHRSIIEQATAMVRGSDAALAHFPALSTAQRQQIARSRDAAQEVLDTLGKTTDTITARNQLRAIEDAQSRGPGAMLSGLLGAGGAYGALEGDPALAGIGLAGAALTRPGMALRQLAALESLAGKASTRINGGASKFFGRASKAAQYGIPRTGSLAWHTLKDSDASDKDRLAYERKADTLRNSTANVARTGIGEAMAPVADTAPAVTEAAKQTAQRAADHLRESLPTGAIPAALLSARPMPSNIELSKFMRKLNAAHDPLGTVFDALDKGDLTRDHIETIRAIYPETYQQMVDTMLDKVADLESKGETLPYQDTLQLSKLLGVPTHGTLRPDVMMAVQQSYAMPEPGQAAGPRAPDGQRIPDLAGAMQTGSEETASEKET